MGTPWPAHTLYAGMASHLGQLSVQVCRRLLRICIGHIRVAGNARCVCGAPLRANGVPRAGARAALALQDNQQVART